MVQRRRRLRGRKYKDFVEDGPLDKTVTGGWIALLQHHFFTAWIPQKDQASRFGLGQTGSVDDGGRQQQPELEEVIYSLQSEPGTDDLGLLDDDDAPIPLPTQFDPRLQRAARLAVLDPDDEIAL